MRRSPEIHLLALGVCGIALGHVAWPGTTWGGALSILLPFMCGLQPTRLRALVVSAGYYLGALGPYAISELLVTQDIGGGEKLATACLVLALSAMAWALTGGHHPTSFRRFLTLLGVWLATLFTPLGGWGLAHPSLGWLFIGQGGMGALTFVAAGVLTSFLVTAIRSERERHAPISAISGRSLACAVCATVILGGTFDQTAAPRHAGPVAAVTTNRSQGELKGSEVQRDQAMRLDVLLGKLALRHPQHEPILLVFIGQRQFDAGLAIEQEAVLQELRATVRRHKIGLVVHMATATLGPTPSNSMQCTAMLPSTMATTITFRSRICKVEKVEMGSPAQATNSSAVERAPLTHFEVAYQPWPRYELKPSLELWSAVVAPAHRARIVVVSTAGDSPWMAHASRFAAKHVLSLAWATRSRVIAETPARGGV